MGLDVYVGSLTRYYVAGPADVVVVAVRREGGETIFNPSGDVRLEAGDVLVAIGRSDSLARLKEAARGGTGILPPLHEPAPE